MKIPSGSFTKRMTEIRFPKPAGDFAAGTECLKKLLKGLSGLKPVFAGSSWALGP